MFYKNARIFCGDHQFHFGSFQVEDGLFTAVLPQVVPADAVDLAGATVIPGLVDCHIHGCAGADFSDGQAESLYTMAKNLARWGITSFAPTAMTLPTVQLEQAFQAARSFYEAAPAGHARLVGIHMEGPYFSYAKRGAQNPAHLRSPDIHHFAALNAASGGLVRLVDVAPELPGALDFIADAAKICTVSLAHTQTDYDTACRAFGAGATQLTHLFNAMPGLHHRTPGPIAAGAEDPHVRAELICDGHHVHPSMVRLAYRLFGPDRLVLVSDALSCCGLTDGSYRLGDQQVQLSGGVAHLADGTLAGAASNLLQDLKNAILFGIPEEAAIQAATFNPACALGVQHRVGSISAGKCADFLVCSADYSQVQVFLAGRELR